MHKLFNKIITLLMVVMLVGTSLIPTAVYAANSVNLNTQTNENKAQVETKTEKQNETEADSSNDKVENETEADLEAEEKISQELVRYLKYNQNTMLSFKVEEGIQNSVYPVKSKEISIVSPKIEGKEPSKVIATGTNINYEYKDGILKIEKIIEQNDVNETDATNKTNDAKATVSNSIETYMITYIYDVQTDAQTITTSAIAKSTLANDTVKEGKEEKEIEVKAEVGSIVELSVNAPEEISEGYMYANLNREEKLETSFSEIYTANIGLADLTDKIVITEEEPTILYTNTKKLNVTGDIVTKKILVIKSEMKSILGENGTITVKDIEGNELGKLSESKPELEVNTSEVILETSTPQKEGNLHIKVDKAIKGTYSKDQMKMFQKLLLKSTIIGYKNEVEISKETKNAEANLKAPTSKANLDVSTKTLSTIVENKDVTFNIVLPKKDIADALYQNPKLKIELPSQITNINPTSAKILYDEEIKAGTLSLNGNTIEVSLEGTQTKYDTVATTNGALIRIVADITLNNLAPSSTEKVKLTYTNELTDETNTAETEVDIVAPTGFVTTNTLDVDGKSVTAIEEDVQEIKINKDKSSKEMKISATVVNNLGTDAEGVTILGRIPFEGNKTVEGKELGSTVNTTISKAITTSGLENAKVYYSENGEENANGSTWTTEPTANTKSFKIVTDDTLEDKSVASFNYTVNLPQTLDYGNVAKATYGVLYSNKSTAGVKTNLVEAKAVGATTGNAPELKVEVSAYDTNDGHAITDGSTVRNGEYITYKVTLSNTGNEDLNNVKLTTKLPDEIIKIEHNTDYGIDKFDYYTSKNEKEIISEIGTLKAKEKKEIQIDVQTFQSTISTSDEAAEDIKKLKVDFSAIAENLEASISKSFTVNNSKGTFAIKLRSDLAGNNNVTKGQKINFIVDVNKVNENDINEATVTLQLPEGIQYLSNNSQIQNEQYQVTNKNNEVVIKLDSENNRSSINVETIALTGDLKGATVMAVIDYDGAPSKIQSNKIIINTETIENSIQASQKTNITTGKPLNTDTIEYYVDIKNIGNVIRLIKFEDDIPNELEIVSYKMIANGQVIHEIDDSYEMGYLMTSFELEPGKTARATIKAKIEGGSGQTIINSPKLTADAQEIKVNSISLNISNNGVTVNDNGYQENNQGNDSNNENAGDNTSNGIYSISGTAWYDINNDGKKDDSEEKLKGIGMILLNATTGEIAKDSNGKELRTSTNENGQYTFSNLNKGSYIAIAVYDISQYTVGTYKIDGSSDIENSDFVVTQYNNEEVGATDSIEITNFNSYNIDLGLVSRNTFDLKLEKTVSKITVTNPKSNTRTYDYNKSLVKVELSNRNIENTTVLVEYKIKVTNEGKIAGYASSIVDYLPEGMRFNSELNPTWYIGQDGNAYNTSLGNTIINPGEIKELTIVLSKKMTGENLGTVRNTAEIQTAYNQYGIIDANSTAGNKQEGEDDMSSADTIIAIGAGREIVRITGITIGILSLIILSIYEVKKRIIDKF